MGTLQVRLFLSFLVVIVVTLGLAALSLFLLLGGYRDSISYGNLERVGSLVDIQAVNELQAARASGTDQPEGVELLLLLRSFLNPRDRREGEAQTSVAIVRNDGAIIQSSPSEPLTGQRIDATNLAAVGPGTHRCKARVGDGRDLLCVWTPASEEVRRAFPDAQVAAIVVAEPAAGLTEVLEDLLPRLVSSGFIGLAAALILGFTLSQSVAAPLRKIARAARSASRGNYRQRVPVTGPREVRDVAANFNRMTEEVQRSQQTLRDFLMNISHELKTPLTSIRGFSQAMVDGTIDDRDGIERSARIISDESTRVLRLVEELLDLSRIESRQSSMRQEDVPVSELLGHVAEVFALRAEESGVTLDIQPSAGLSVRGDFDRLEQVLNNLLDNAFRHTPAGGRVSVWARPVQRGFVQITVGDTGRGIPPDDLPHLFERFYRAANGRNTRGYGLGLAITREIVRAHGGDIWATSEPGRGTQFVFTLPAQGTSVPQATTRVAAVERAPASG